MHLGFERDLFMKNGLTIADEAGLSDDINVIEINSDEEKTISRERSPGTSLKIRGRTF